MELQPPGVPVTDPFLAAVRGRLPDVDVVVLAPEARSPGASGPPGEPVGDDVVTATLEAVRCRARTLWARVVGGAQPQAWLAPGPASGTVVARSRHGVAPGPPDALTRLAAALHDSGWRIAAPVAPGRSGRWLAASTSGRLGPLALDATYAAATGALVVSLASAPLPVGRRRAHELVRS